MKNKTVKIIVIALVAVLLVGAAIAVFCVGRHNRLYISKTEALNIALNDIDPTVVVIDTDVEFDKGSVTSVYEIDLDTSKGEFEYKINASTGEILYSNLDLDD